MARAAELPSETAQSSPAQEVMADDYERNMFQDGNNRAKRDRNVQKAPEYDRAAHTPDADAAVIGAEFAAPASATTAPSRDGTEAAGLYDETGGPLGGTEAELDSLENSNTPVDRTPRMKA